MSRSATPNGRHHRSPGRHRRPPAPSTLQRNVTGAGLVTALLVAEGLALATNASAAPSADDWARLRMCESTNRYTVNTGNGYYGAYQFDLPTWLGLGYSGLPSAAAPAVQDEAALKLYEQRGWQPWPACSRKLGLVAEDRASRSAPREPLTAPARPAPANPAPAPTAAAPSSSSTTWAGRLMRTSDVRQVRSDVAAWQTRMNELGYSLGRGRSVRAGVRRRLHPVRDRPWPEDRTARGRRPAGLGGRVRGLRSASRRLREASWRVASAVAGVDHAEPVALRIGEHDEVRVVRVQVPVDALRAE